MFRENWSQKRSQRSSIKAGTQGRGSPCKMGWSFALFKKWIILQVNSHSRWKPWGATLVAALAAPIALFKGNLTRLLYTSGNMALGNGFNPYYS
jgi:hypothetical protein